MLIMILLSKNKFIPGDTFRWPGWQVCKPVLLYHQNNQLRSMLFLIAKVMPTANPLNNLPIFQVGAS
ncbi:hypothetical protein AT727_16780 [Desulfitobacterium hafniense]|uniref:Uncharacterized protein n=1 Tax=Desulfitobacterium hafniense TaxID=49338 RepID=A0A0W1JMI9_DESHA|nr:hypothetical protein AT727_16780 [Desulfitobacterium hafniense]